MAGRESWLRVVIYELPDDQDSGLEFVRSHLGEFISVLRAQPGYTGGYWGDSPSDRTIAAITHWNGLDAIKDAGLVLQELQSRGTSLGFSVLDVQNIRIATMFSDGGPMGMPASGLVPGHPHQMRVRNRRGAAEVVVQTRLRVIYSHAGAGTGDYLKASGPQAQARLQAQPGFVLGYAGSNDRGDTLAAVTYWTDEAALAGAEPLFAEIARERADNGVELASMRTLRLFPLPVESALPADSDAA